MRKNIIRKFVVEENFRLPIMLSLTFPTLTYWKGIVRNPCLLSIKFNAVEWAWRRISPGLVNISGVAMNGAIIEAVGPSAQISELTVL